ncbi:MAG: hypothetical protein LBM02_09880 [Lachnospiraceae bacterium]|jgi:NTP pyrophosphatase (non-canonical NTP hydrolase)|nr:hypothetical protein [Lachnospiraceae bacterium]
MTISEYQKEAKRTVGDLGSLKLNLAHMVMGITSELEEIYRASLKNDIVNLNEEIADVIWYLANYCTFRNFNFEEIIGNIMYKSIFDLDILEFDKDDIIDNLPVLETSVSLLTDYVKKYVAYNKPFDVKKEKQAILGIVLALTNLTLDFNFDTDLQKNIDKLKQRYPEKFTEERALNRDLEVERKILEK